MASTYSFDIVSSFDRQELKNALDQTRREVQQRYDLKDTKSTIEDDAKSLTITTASEISLQAIRDMLESKIIRRGLSLKILEYEDVQEVSGGRVRQVVTLKEGIPEDLAKQITKRLRDEFKKVNAQIQGDAVRVQGKNKDDLQSVIVAMKEADYPVALQFVNYR
ncbi:MAG: YajQ family cyclic di-GMP-binding protein [Thermomicrobiales bacterium]